MESSNEWVVGGNAPYDAIALTVIRHWDERLERYANNQGEDRAFEQLVTIANWLNRGAKWAPLEYVYANTYCEGASWQAPTTWTLPWWTTEPAPLRLAHLKHSLPVGFTLDATDAARAGGLDFPLSVTVQAWKSAIEYGEALGLDNKLARLTRLIDLVGNAYRRNKRDVHTWYEMVNNLEEDVTSLKAIQIPDAWGSTRLTVMMNWEGNE